MRPPASWGGSASRPFLPRAASCWVPEADVKTRLSGHPALQSVPRHADGQSLLRDHDPDVLQGARRPALPRALWRPYRRVHGRTHQGCSRRASKARRIWASGETSVPATTCRVSRRPCIAANPAWQSSSGRGDELFVRPIQPAAQRRGIGSASTSIEDLEQRLCVLAESHHADFYTDPHRTALTNPSSPGDAHPLRRPPGTGPPHEVGEVRCAQDRRGRQWVSLKTRPMEWPVRVHAGR